MHVEAVRIEREDDRRAMTTNQCDERAPDLIRFGVIELAIAVVEYVQVANAHDPGYTLELRLSTGGKILRPAHRRVARLATLPESCCDEGSRYSLRLALHRQADAVEALVVRMRKTEQQGSAHDAIIAGLSIWPEPFV